MFRILLILVFVGTSNLGYSSPSFKELKNFNLPRHTVKTRPIQRFYFVPSKRELKPTILLKKSVLAGSHEYEKSAGNGNFYKVSGWVIAGMGAAILFGQLLFKGLFGGIFDDAGDFNVGPPLAMIGAGTILIIIGSKK